MIDPRDFVTAEQAVLGAMMLSAAAIAAADDLITGADFRDPRHETIYLAIADLRDRNMPVDALIVSEQLAKSGDLNHVGGAAYLHTLINTVPFTGSAGSYAEIVRKHAARRLLAATGTWLHQAGNDDGTDLDDVPELYRVAIDRLTAAMDATPSTRIPIAADMLGPVLDRVEHPETTPAVATGIHDLDDLLGGGLRPGSLTVVGARPRIGKSVFAGDLMRNAAIRHGIRSLLASLEMSDDEVMIRIISAAAGVNISHLRTGKCDDRDWDLIAKVVPAIDAAPLHIAYAPALGLAGLRQMIRGMQRDGLGLVVVDYVQLMEVPRAENRQLAVSEVSRGLKRLSQEYQVPIVALAQLNRESEKRSDKQPAMSDLRESGSLENDADVIILLHREDAYERESPRAGEIDLIVPKNRFGPQATITAAFQGHYSRIVSMATEPWTPHAAMSDAA